MTRHAKAKIAAMMILALGLLVSWSAVKGSGGDDGDIKLLNAATLSPIRANEPVGANGDDQIVHFVPQDLSTNATVLILINTNDTVAAGQLEMYRIDGVYLGGWDITLQPRAMLRICTDPVNSTEAYWNFTNVLDLTGNDNYAKLTLPPGVIYDGYVVWNDGPEYNPAVPAQTLPLRFMSE